MRITVYQKVHVSLLSLIVLLLVVVTVFVPGLSAQEEKSLFIEIYDANTSEQLEDNIFFEGKTYDVLVVETGDSEFIVNVTVTVPWATYLISEETPFASIETPRFDEYDSFLINASKEGYLPAEVEITVLKGSLSVVANRGTVEETKKFNVTVTDQNHTPIEGAFVYGGPEATPVMTDVQGIAFLDAPAVDEDRNVVVQVIKSGYAPGSTTIRVENIEGFTFVLPESLISQILPLLFAVLVVIFAILLVRWRKKKAPTILHQVTREEIPEKPQAHLGERPGRHYEKELALFPVKEPKKVSISTPDPRVEEIRIPLQRKKKETTIVSSEKEPVQTDQKKDEHEWFKGQDYMRYKLDEITGKIDEKTDGKWFEGERDNKYKVDETLKKSSKKKKVDEDDVK